MGYIVLGLFASIPKGFPGSWIQMINHAIVTGALFLTVGMIYERTHTQEISAYGGVLTPSQKFFCFPGFLFHGFCWLPGLNGFVGEVLTMIGAAKGKYLVWKFLQLSGPSCCYLHALDGTAGDFWTTDQRPR
ncbi:MAG: hypothetical protein Ct9H300mP21_07180 [Pseudomonadota bacterium]|nr:MAG: hypothetical protein Ct9H300mP21_07180 [Pseudomonadota bacterium]